jgi:hypothetical protein
MEEMGGKLSRYIEEVEDCVAWCQASDASNEVFADLINKNAKKLLSEKVAIQNELFTTKEQLAQLDKSEKRLRSSYNHIKYSQINPDLYKILQDKLAARCVQVGTLENQILEL